MDVEDLTRALAKDLDGSFPDLVKAMEDQLYSGLRRMTGDSADAEDLTQETLIRAYRALSSYGPGRIEELKLRGWMWTIALNLGRNHLRDRARRPVPVAEVDGTVVEDPPTSGGDWDRRLQKLSRDQRRAVVLRHVVDLDYEEISAATGRPLGTVKNDVHRGLERLRRIMEDEE
ncbi:MAG TPA: RNA polymerase sigma factor [Acidimicrobiia bacterium]|jgi:RNA polymerase sigma-70 factor (ECF subfamily)